MGLMTHCLCVGLHAIHIAIVSEVQRDVVNVGWSARHGRKGGGEGRGVGKRQES